MNHAADVSTFARLLSACRSLKLNILIEGPVGRVVAAPEELRADAAGVYVYPTDRRAPLWFSWAGVRFAEGVTQESSGSVTDVPLDRKAIMETAPLFGAAAPAPRMEGPGQGLLGASREAWEAVLRGHWKSEWDHALGKPGYVVAMKTLGGPEKVWEYADPDGSAARARNPARAAGDLFNVWRANNQGVIRLLAGYPTPGVPIVTPEMYEPAPKDLGPAPHRRTPDFDPPGPSVNEDEHIAPERWYDRNAPDGYRLRRRAGAPPPEAMIDLLLKGAEIGRQTSEVDPPGQPPCTCTDKPPCICGPDSTGEDIVEDPACPAHDTCPAHQTTGEDPY